VFTTAYSPQTNGQVERFNRTILNSLRTYVAKIQTDWDEYTAAIIFGYNSRVNASLGFAIWSWFYRGRHRRCLWNNSLGTLLRFQKTKREDLYKDFKELVPLAKYRLLEAQRRYKENFDRHTRVVNQGLSKESWVFLRRDKTNPEGSSKLVELADGPYRVVKSEDIPWSFGSVTMTYASRRIA
jgi:hypothetical protein